MRSAALALLATLLVAAPAAAQSPVIATVDGAGELTRAEYRHWKEIARRAAPRSSERAQRRQVMQLLLQNLWVRGEAAHRGIVVTDDEVRREFRKQRRKAFRRPRDFRRFLRQSGYTTGDILYRVRLELLSNRLRRQVVDGIAPVTDEEARAHYDANRGEHVVPERRTLRYAVGRTRAAALSKPKRLRRSGTRTTLPRAVFQRRRGVVRWRGRWLAFMVVRVRPGRRLSFEEALPAIRGMLRAERQQAALDAFIEEFRERWRAATTCREPYATGDCGRTTP